MPAIGKLSPSLVTVPFHRNFTTRNFLLYGAGLLALATGMWMILHGQFNLLAAGIFLCAFLMTAARNKGMAILLCLIYLFLLGDIRRILNMTGEVPKFDPLLLVGPIFSFLLALPILMRLRLRDAMTKAVFALMVVMAFEIVNPKQGPVVVGIAGAMFYIVPLFWFWLGQRYGTISLLQNVIWTVIPLGALAATLGLFQTFVGFLPWEAAWIKNAAAHTNSYNLGGGFIRAFGYSVNTVEFVGVLMASCTACMALYFAGRRIYGILVPFLAFAIFLSSSRTAVLNCLFGMAATWALSSRGGRGWGLRLTFAIFVGAMTLVVASSRVGQSKADAGTDSAVAASTRHQVAGLTDPSHSTAGIHSQMFLAGILKGVEYPIGYGLGATTLGSSKLGGDESAHGSSEIDLSDVFTVTGVVGGSIYLIIWGLIANRSVRFSRLAPRSVGLPVLGIITCMLTGWLGLGRYSMTALIWFLLGSICKFTMEHDDRSRSVSSGHEVRANDPQLPEMA